MKTTSQVSWLSLGACLLLGACASSAGPDTDSDGGNADANRKPVAAHLACTTTDAGQYDLELLLQPTGAIDATMADGAVELSGTLSKGRASLGQFLSGTYAVALTNPVLGGEAGNVVLIDDEGPANGGADDIAYTCAPQAPVAAVFACTPADASQLPLQLTTSADGKLVADYAGGAVSWDSTLAGGDATLGMFLSGAYSVHVDTDVLDGRDGAATLFDDEGPANGGVAALAYHCAKQ